MAAWLPGSSETQRCRLVLLRHGQTPYSTQGKYAGRSDIPLTDEGHRQAHRAGRWLREADLTAAVTSPALRCRQTLDDLTKELVPGSEQPAELPVDVVDNLIELDFGEWDGRTFKDIHDHFGETQEKWFTDWTMPVPGGESVQAVDQRVHRAVTELVDQHWGDNLLLVSHVTPIKSVLRRALCADSDFFVRLHLDTSSISIVDFYSDGPICVQAINSTAHLVDGVE